MSSRKEVEEQFKKINFKEPAKLRDWQVNTARNALLRKIKAQIKDEERASKKYFDLSVEAKLVDTEISSEIYKISGEEFVHKTMLEGMYRKLGGKI